MTQKDLQDGKWLFPKGSHKEAQLVQQATQGLGEGRGRGRERSEHGHSDECTVIYIHVLSIIPHIHVTTKSYHQHTYIHNY